MCEEYYLWCEIFQIIWGTINGREFKLWEKVS